jgi:hypothetical protein
VSSTSLDRAFKVSVWVLFALLFYCAVWAAMALLNVPDDLPWYRVFAGGGMIGIAGILCDKLT